LLTKRDTITPGTSDSISFMSFIASMMHSTLRLHLIAHLHERRRVRAGDS
jgi:hypothetical protein